MGALPRLGRRRGTGAGRNRHRRYRDRHVLLPRCRFSDQSHFSIRARAYRLLRSRYSNHTGTAQERREGELSSALGAWRLRSGVELRRGRGDWKSVVTDKRVAVTGDLGGGLIMKKTKES